MGVSAQGGGVNVAVAFDHLPLKEGGIILYDRKKKPTKIPFPEDCRIGNMYAAFLQTDISAFHSYLFYCDDKEFMDPYATAVDGRNVWGKPRGEKDKLYGLLPREDDFDWGSDRFPERDYKDTIIYGLHVRGFTKHHSSGVDRMRRGTFEGIEDKIPYLQELGITAVECMPVYDFDELIVNPAYESAKSIEESLKKAKLRDALERGEAPEEALQKEEENTGDASESGMFKDNWHYKINYWGFSERGNYYFAPKASFSAYHDPVRSFKHLVRALHRAGIEIILQLYFPLKYDPCYIQRVVHHWVTQYHVDGFHLVGMKIPRSLLALDPMLARTKLIMEEPGGERIYAERKRAPGFKNLASYKDDFKCDARKFLKGDEDMLRAMAAHMRENEEVEAVIHHVADYRGFTLLDLVSFDQKHNGPNGENNRDGSEYNYSWNCGTEGSSRKKAILSMRLSQRKNILGFLFLSQGVPFIKAGDEFGHTANGNNNPYCQDNEINWLCWKPDQTGKKLLAYTKELIAFRKSHPILHRKQPMRLMDSISCGYPDMSYHGQNAWYAQMENYNRHMGVMLCGLYENLPSGKSDDFIYIAMNMHWIAHDFALPGLPGGYEWKIVCDSKSMGDDAHPGAFYKEGMDEETLRAYIIERSGREKDSFGMHTDSFGVFESGNASDESVTPQLPKTITVRPRSMVVLLGRRNASADEKKRLRATEKDEE